MDDDINLLDYWRIIVKRRWLIVGLAIVCAFTALIYSLMQPKLYKATATIMPVDTGGGGLASALSAVPFFASNDSGNQGKLIPILKSRTLASNVANNLEIKDYLPDLAKNQKIDKIKKEYVFTKMLRGALNVKSSKGILNISIVWSEPQQAAKLANFYVERLGLFLNNRSLNVNFHVIDLAPVPEGKFKPKIKINTIIGLFFGFFSGIFFAFFLEYLDSVKAKSA